MEIIDNQNGKPYSGMICGNFKLSYSIEDLDDFWNVINKKKSIFARHKIYPASFFLKWKLQTIVEWIDNNWFFVIVKI